MIYSSRDSQGNHPATEQESMCQGLNDDPDTTQMGEHSLDEVPEGVEDPGTATSPGAEGLVKYVVLHISVRWHATVV